MQASYSNGSPSGVAHVISCGGAHGGVGKKGDDELEHTCAIHLRGFSNKN